MTEILPATEFCGLYRDGPPGAWALPVDASLLSGTGALFGGAALGVAIALAEQHSGRPLVWATVQFVRHVRPPAVLQLNVTEPARGRRASQVAGAARLDGDDVFTFVATTGDRDGGGIDQTWVSPPPVPAVEHCPPRPALKRHRGRFMERTEVRWAKARATTGSAGGSPGTSAGPLAVDGRSAVWARIPGLEPGAATLGMLGDYVPLGLREALGDGWATHSLDNSIRVLRSPDSGWVLADIVMEGIASGFGHGRVHLWDDAGQLLATATQSFTCRRRDD